MNVSKLLVLGSLEQLGRGSGYDVLQALQRRMIDKWVDVKVGSIYYTINQLEKEGALQEIERIQEGNYPTKAIYEVTEVGQQLFDKLQAEAFLGLYPRFYGFKVALKFNRRKSPDDIRQFADKAIAVIDSYLAAMDEHLSTLDPDGGLYQFDDFFIDHERRLFEAEKQWIEDAVAWITSNQALYEAQTKFGE